MKAQNIKFIHASDFQLGRAVHYFSDETESRHQPVFIPSDIRTKLPPSFYKHYISASFQSAKNVFDAAINHRVNFVLITGSVFYRDEPDAYAIRFFDQQLRRLEEQGIWVCWVVENDAPVGDSPLPPLLEAWWDTQPMPENVAIFNGRNTCKKNFRIPLHQPGSLVPAMSDDPASGQEPDVSLIYVPSSATDAGEILRSKSTCKILMGKFADLKRLGSEHDFTYGCILGESRRQIYGAKFEDPDESASFFHTPGATQGYSPAVFKQSEHSEQPVFGCSLIEISPDSSSPLSTRFIETETISWRLHSVDMPASVVNFQAIADLLKNETAKMSQNLPPTSAGILVVWFLHSQFPQHAELLTRIHLENQTLVTDKSTEIILAPLLDSSASENPFLCHLAVFATPRDIPLLAELPPNTAACDFQRLIETHLISLKNNKTQTECDDANSPFCAFAHHTLDFDDFLSSTQKSDVLKLLAAALSSEKMENLLHDADLLGSLYLSNYEDAASTLNAPFSHKNGEKEAEL